MALRRTVPYSTVPYGNVPKLTPIRCARKRHGTNAKRLFPYGIHVVLEVREEAVSWPPRGFIYAAAA
jgi:hypothetical protein